MMYNASKQRGLVLVVHSAAISSSKMEIRNDNRWDVLSSLFMPCPCSLPAHFSCALLLDSRGQHLSLSLRENIDELGWAI